MVDLAERLGADPARHRPLRADRRGRRRARCSPPPPTKAKDQSYMLAALPPAMLDRLGFPLTELTKPEVREIAARHGLSVAKKPESQDLCFLAGQGKERFLRRHGGLGERDGAVLDRAGRKLGRHRGHHNFTVGQRRGIGVSAPRAALRPRHRRRRQHGHRRHPRRAGDAPRADPRRRPAPRRRPRRRGPAALPLATPVPASVAARRPAAIRRSSSSWTSPSTPPRRARRRSC